MIDRTDKPNRVRLFTELSVSKLKHLKNEVGKQIVYYDRRERGLILRLNKTGSKAWRVLYYVDGKTKSDALGYFKPGAPDHVSVKAARDAAANFRANKSTILADRAKQALANRDNFEMVAERYLKRFVDGKRRTAPQMRKLVERLYPKWGTRPFEGIKRSDVSAMLDEIEDSRGPRAADVTLAVLRSMMADRANRSDEYSSPIVKGMARIKNPKERARDRILSDDEIRTMFAAADGQGGFGNFVKMLLFTAQRRSKVATMAWADLDGEIWTIATQDREKGNAERLKLPKPALAIIETQRELRTNDYVFPSSYRTTRADEPGTTYGSLSAFADGKAALDTAMAEIMPNIPHWTLHDLRRTARSLMSRAKVRPDIAERVLGHAIPGVQGVYDRHAYDLERAQALVALSTLITRILEPKRMGNVVTLKR